MKKTRVLEELTAILIIATCVLGLIFAFGLFQTPSAEALQMYTVLLTILVLIYYIFEFRRLKNKYKGFVFPDVRCCLMMAVWTMSVISLLYLGPMHASLDGNLKAAAFVMLKVLPVELVLDWMAGRKGTFRTNYIWKSFLLIIPYTMFALLLGHAGHGIGLGSSTYPYPFLNADQLGWKIVCCNLLIILIGMIVLGVVFVLIDEIAGGLNDKTH